MNRIGSLLLATALLGATLWAAPANSVETIGRGSDVKITVEDFSPPKAMTCWRLTWRGWAKHPCKCVQCNWHLPWQSRLCWRVC